MTVDSTISVSVSREIMASPEQVYDAWLNPAMVPQWFAPGMGPMARVDIDPRLGGVFHLDQQRDADIARHWGVYLELERPNRLVFTWCVDGADDEDIVSIDITALASGEAKTGSTVSVTHQLDASYADYTEATRQGWRAMLHGLARGVELAETANVEPDAPRLVLQQHFAAAPELVFQAWTDPDLAGQWLFASPKSEYSLHEFDPRPGGTWTITDRRDGTDYTATGEYLTVEIPHRLEFTFAMPQFSPGSDRITVTIEPWENSVQMTMVQEGEDIADELRQTAEGAMSGSEEGWTRMFNNLGGVLARSVGHGVVAASDTIVFERRLPTTIEQAWSWLVDSDRRGQWLASGTLPTEAGAEFTWFFHHANLSPQREPIPERFREIENGVSSHHRVLHYEAPHFLSITWGDGGTDHSEVAFELRNQNKGTLLVLTHSKLANAAAMVDVAGGWHTHLAVLTDKVLGITPPSFWVLMEGIEEDYRRRIGDG